MTSRYKFLEKVKQKAYKMRLKLLITVIKSKIALELSPNCGRTIKNMVNSTIILTKFISIFGKDKTNPMRLHQANAH